MLPSKEGQKRDAWLAGDAREKEPPLEGPRKHKADLQAESLQDRVSRMSSGTRGSVPTCSTSMV